MNANANAGDGKDLTVTADYADTEEREQEMDNNHRPPSSPDEGIDSDDGKGQEYQYQDNPVDAANALEMNEANFCTPVKDDKEIFKLPIGHGRGARIRPFVHREDDDSTGSDSPLRKKQMAEPLMSSTPLGRPEITDVNGSKSGFEAMRQSGLPVKNLFLDFSSCANSILDEIFRTDDEDPILSSIGLETSSDCTPLVNESFVINSFSDCVLGAGADILNHKILDVDEGDLGLEKEKKPPTLKGSIWSLEEQLRLLQLDRASPTKTAIEEHSSPEYEKNGSSDGGKTPKRKRGDCSIDSGVFEHQEGSHKHHARVMSPLAMETETADAVEEIERRIDSVAIE